MKSPYLAIWVKTKKYNLLFRLGRWDTFENHWCQADLAVPTLVSQPSEKSRLPAGGWDIYGQFVPTPAQMSQPRDIACAPEASLHTVVARWFTIFFHPPTCSKGSGSSFGVSCRVAGQGKNPRAAKNVIRVMRACLIVGLMKPFFDIWDPGVFVLSVLRLSAGAARSLNRGSMVPLPDRPEQRLSRWHRDHGAP